MRKKEIQYKHWQTIFIYIISVLILYSLYSKLSKINFQELKETFRYAKEVPYFNFYIVFLAILYPLNFILEAVKWQSLLERTYSVSLWKSLKMVFAGIASSTIFPNRTGDFIGKIYLLPAKKQLSGFMLSTIGNIMQMSTTCIFGLLGIYYWSHHGASLEYKNYVYLASLIILLVVAISILYWQSILRVISRFMWVRRFRTQLSHLKNIPNSVLYFAFALSIIRYLVFTTEIYILYHLGGSDAGWTEIVLTTSCVYLVMMLIPSNLILDIFVRSSVSLYFFGLLGISSALILSNTYIIYIFNVLIPALIGLIILQSNITNNNK